MDQIKTFAKAFNSGENPFKPVVKYKWIRKNGKRKRVKQRIQVQYTDYLIQEWQLFIRALEPQTNAKRLKMLDQQFYFSQTHNSEILCDWFVLAANSDYIFAIEPQLKAFLQKIGRRKFVLPIYEALARSPEGLRLGRNIFQEAKANYHSVTRNSAWKALYTKD